MSGRMATTTYSQEPSTKPRAISVSTGAVKKRPEAAVCSFIMIPSFSVYAHMYSPENGGRGPPRPVSHGLRVQNRAGRIVELPLRQLVLQHCLEQHGQRLVALVGQVLVDAEIHLSRL